MLKTIYNLGILKENKIILDGIEYPVIHGKHAVYIKQLNAKIIWSHNGKIESLKDWDKGRNAESIKKGTFGSSLNIFSSISLESIASEYLILEMLSKDGVVPPVNGMFYIKSFISYFPYGIDYCDPKGRYGYYMEDAEKLPCGKYSYEEFCKRYVDTKIIQASDGALGDFKKYNNTVNGYLVDIRRTLWDMILFTDTKAVNKFASSIEYYECEKDLKEKILYYGQFPFQNRKGNYQSYLYMGKYVEGSRDTLHRYDRMEVPEDLTNKTVLDLGCCTGSMCLEACNRGAVKVTGLDFQNEFIDCARDLARVNSFNINYIVMDMMKPDTIIQYVNKYYDNPIDIVFALSLYKHVRNNLWEILDNINYKTLYLESHNAPEGLNTGHALEMSNYLDGLKNCTVEYLGITEDRSPRCIWKVQR